MNRANYLSLSGLCVCVQVMRVLRDNRDSVMAMLEAFVYDPLISWRLLANNRDDSIDIRSNTGAPVVAASQSVSSATADVIGEPSLPVAASVLDNAGGLDASMDLTQGINSSSTALGEQAGGGNSLRLQMPSNTYRDSETIAFSANKSYRPLAGGGSMLDQVQLRRNISGGDPAAVDEPKQETLNARCVVVLSKLQN